MHFSQFLSAYLYLFIWWRLIFKVFVYVCANQRCMFLPTERLTCERTCLVKFILFRLPCMFVCFFDELNLKHVWWHVLRTTSNNIIQDRDWNLFSALRPLFVKSVIFQFAIVYLETLAVTSRVLFSKFGSCLQLIYKTVGTVYLPIYESSNESPQLRKNMTCVTIRPLV